MYKQYKEDPKQALENYKKALSLGSSQSIKEVYDAAGIRFDFSGETIKELMLFVEKELELLEIIRKSCTYIFGAAFFFINQFYVLSISISDCRKR